VIDYIITFPKLADRVAVTQAVFGWNDPTHAIPVQGGQFKPSLIAEVNEREV
jgi:hypothetical protein